ncbi:hypothetical protein [Arthrobacter sp. MMS18-M83]|uniref:hypothetical protein n=1 Tax=Arthrobacter sp. MMS18-M83 TaxID=2996261 RepID=UPI00227D3708|nr:hypothetical protein [Arthrobacter sp. MMS18-M83]WAH97384.1 hypothetical protein OW521_00275 [Arthrobacter sp. MMS18-M83]
MSATSPVARHPHLSAFHLSRRVTAGVTGGIAGGLVFGLLMAMMGMLPMVASLVGSTSAWAGFGIHMVISVLVGLGLTVPFAGVLGSYGRGVLVGLGYGAVWWVLGPLVIMPAILGMPLFMVNMMAGLSLMGHLAYGATLALVAVRVLKGRA